MAQDDPITQAYANSDLARAVTALEQLYAEAGVAVPPDVRAAIDRAGVVTKRIYAKTMSPYVHEGLGTSFLNLSDYLSPDATSLAKASLGKAFRILGVVPDAVRASKSMVGEDEFRAIEASTDQLARLLDKQYNSLRSSLVGKGVEADEFNQVFSGIRHYITSNGIDMANRSHQSNNSVLVGDDSKPLRMSASDTTAAAVTLGPTLAAGGKVWSAVTHPVKTLQIVKSSIDAVRAGGFLKPVARVPAAAGKSLGNLAGAALIANNAGNFASGATATLSDPRSKGTSGYNLGVEAAARGTSSVLDAYSSTYDKWGDATVDQANGKWFWDNAVVAPLTTIVSAKDPTLVTPLAVGASVAQHITRGVGKGIGLGYYAVQSMLGNTSDPNKVHDINQTMNKFNDLPDELSDYAINGGNDPLNYGGRVLATMASIPATVNKTVNMISQTRLTNDAISRDNEAIEAGKGERLKETYAMRRADHGSVADSMPQLAKDADAIRSQFAGRSKQFSTTGTLKP